MLPWQRVREHIDQVPKARSGRFWVRFPRAIADRHDPDRYPVPGGLAELGLLGGTHRWRLRLY